MKKKAYISPEILKIELDSSISLQMQTTGNAPIYGDPGTKRGGDNNSSPASSPLASPFSDKPFN